MIIEMTDPELSIELEENSLLYRPSNPVNLPQCSPQRDDISSRETVSPRSSCKRRMCDLDYEIIEEFERSNEPVYCEDSIFLKRFLACPLPSKKLVRPCAMPFKEPAGELAAAFSPFKRIKRSSSSPISVSSPANFDDLEITTGLQSVSIIERNMSENGGTTFVSLYDANDLN